MLNKEELEELGHIFGFNLWQTERDYFQHLFLMFLSRRTGDELVFKGGTAFQKVFGLNRFSIDLDFTLNHALPLNLWEDIKRDFGNFGVKAEFESSEQKNSLKVKLAIEGPSYEGTERTLIILRVEISQREKVLLKPETKEIFPAYPDLQPYLVRVMNLDEIMAEKIRAILTRDKARDMFDLRFLLNKKVKINEKLVNEKLKAYRIIYSKTLLLEKISQMEKVWHNELSQLMVAAPEFKEVVKEIKEKV
ncbi:MAG: nucleotidyl transferase AbiEii/AbiGii toxin family protein [Nanoarchaeota archaeon]